MIPLVGPRIRASPATGVKMQKAGQAHRDESKIVTTLQAYMLNTKVGRYEKEVENMFDYSAERVTRSVEESLARMGLDYIDCIQVRHSVLLVLTQNMM